MSLAFLDSAAAAAARVSSSEVASGPFVPGLTGATLPDPPDAATPRPRGAPGSGSAAPRRCDRAPCSTRRRSRGRRGCRRGPGRSRPPGARTSWPARGTTARRAAARIRSGSCQPGRPASWSAPSTNHSRAPGSSRGDRLEGVGRVARPLAVELDARDREPGHAGDGRLEPGRAAVAVARGAGRLVGRHPGRHQQHDVQVELPQRLRGHDQVPDVGRVEGAAEDADPASRRLRAVSGRARAP